MAIRNQINLDVERAMCQRHHLADIVHVFREKTAVLRRHRTGYPLHLASENFHLLSLNSHFLRVALRDLLQLV